MSVAVKDSSCFQLKSDFIPMTVLRLTSTDIAAVTAQLNETIAKAPNYLKNAPLIIDLSSIQPSMQKIDINQLCEQLRQHQIIPVGIRGLAKEHEATARNNQLAILKKSKSVLR